MKTNFDYRSCPKCGNTNTFQRRGEHFDHERYCGRCQDSYDPEQEYQKYLELDEERLSFNSHRD